MYKRQKGEVFQEKGWSLEKNRRWKWHTLCSQWMERERESVLGLFKVKFVDAQEMVVTCVMQ